MAGVLTEQETCTLYSLLIRRQMVTNPHPATLLGAPFWEHPQLLRPRYYILQLDNLVKNAGSRSITCAHVNPKEGRKAPKKSTPGEASPEN